MDCETLLPRQKWVACEKLERLQNIHELNLTVKVTDTGKACCVSSLHGKMYDLYRWDERQENGNIGLEHLVETFYAVLCYTVLHPQSELVDDDEIEYVDLKHWVRHLNFIRNQWYDLITDKTRLSPHLNTIIQNSTFTTANVDGETDIYAGYLTEYLRARDLNLEFRTYKDMSNAHYAQLFDEYFDGRHQGLVNVFGGYGPNEHTKRSFVTVHVKTDFKSCVGFVCLKENLQHDEPALEMRGIVACPFYRRCHSNENGRLGAANSLIAYLNRHRNGHTIRVDPIRENIKWSNRLADFPFFVNSKNERLQKRETCDSNKRQKISEAASSSSIAIIK